MRVSRNSWTVSRKLAVEGLPVSGDARHAVLERNIVVNRAGVFC